jgi:hypothetical protein
MTDDKVFDLATKKPFELVTGADGTSDQQIIVLIERFLKYARERKFQAVAIVMVDDKHSTITGYHMEEGMGMTLTGGLDHMIHRLHKFMDTE